jgi:Icc-related predicted phosphoesterase
MRINYFSDLHLEFGDQQLPETDADIIVAAGDIGVFTQGVEWLKALKKPVIYVAGNHEFYRHDYQQVLAMLRLSCANSNIKFLEKEVFIYQGIRFLACTLWTDLFVQGEETARQLATTLNDFRKISYAGGVFNPSQFSALHQESKHWLQLQLAEAYAGKTVVITHHAPTEWSWAGSAKSTKKLAYCNNLKDLIYEYPITAWFHGHVHNQGDYRIADARILSNTRGYQGRNANPLFEINKTVDV